VAAVARALVTGRKLAVAAALAPALVAPATVLVLVAPRH